MLPVFLTCRILPSVATFTNTLTLSASPARNFKAFQRADFIALIAFSVMCAK